MGQFERRKFLLAAGTLLAAPVAARAQPTEKIYRIGVLTQGIPQKSFVALPTALRKLGYEEGRNFVFDYRFANYQASRLPELAASLVAEKVDLILAVTNAEILAAKQATSTIPIVMLAGLVPVEMGMVASLGRPGGNLTGTVIIDPDTAGKILQLLRDAVLRASRVFLLVDEAGFPGMDLYNRVTRRAAASMGIRLTQLEVGSVAELNAAFDRILRERPDAVKVVTGSTTLRQHQARVIEFAARERLPVIYTSKAPVLEGGLMSYNCDYAALYPRTAAIVDRVLKGANPAEIPIEQPTKYELVINMKTAKALGLPIPQSLLLRADQVIE
jgi:ABC-type uncharacterized transport system substrate-binding protein